MSIRFGVVGTNNITDWVIEGARQDSRFELTAVCSRTQERADEFAAKHNIPYTFTSLEEMASSDKVDAVYIATDKPLHTKHTLMALEAGKHVLSEIPSIETLEEAKILRDAVSNLSDRERIIVELRFGLGNGIELTQKEVAEKLGISQSYISRLEKRIMLRLRKELIRQTRYPLESS